MVSMVPLHKLVLDQRFRRYVLPDGAARITVMSRSVTKPLRQVTLPSGLAILTSGRVVRSASAPSRRGRSAIRRYR